MREMNNLCNMQYIKNNSRILYYDNDKKTAAYNDL